jgi:hypothetical protein
MEYWDNGMMDNDWVTGERLEYWNNGMLGDPIISELSQLPLFVVLLSFKRSN